MKSRFLLLLALVAVVMTGCKAPENITYMKDAETIPAEVLKATAKVNDPIIQPGDMLQINVSGSNPEVIAPFNKSSYIASSGNSNLNNQENSIFYYLVDNDGCIEYPMIGKIKVGGKTQSQVQSDIASKIYPKYLTEKPGVEVRFQNFHVYTMGEVNNPGQIKAANGRITILEAIAQSGDLTIHGKRENILVIHTNADGSREVNRVDLTSKNVLTSPVYNLRQNDVIYVEPNETKQRSSWSIPPVWSFATSVLGVVLSIATLVITIAK